MTPTSIRISENGKEGAEPKVEAVAEILRPDLFGPNATHHADCPYCNDNRAGARKRAAEIIAALAKVRP